MQEIFGNLKNALKEIWTNIGIAQKVSIILMIIATMAVMGVVVYMGSRPQWDILYSGMDMQTAAGVAGLIRDEGVDYKLKDSGRTILVQGKHIDKLKLIIAQSDFHVEPNSNIKGFELFETAPLGMTEKQQKVMEIRAQTGELQKIINELPSVKSSKVILTFPEKRIFHKTQERPSASVMVVLHRGKTLNTDSIYTIQHQVSTAIAGMQPNDVTISDSNGRTLVRKQKDGDVFGGDANNQMAIQQRMEEELKEKAEAILRPIVGAENVLAMVSLEVDFDDHLTKKVNYDIKKQVILKEKLLNEENTKTAGEIGGKTGTETNLTVAVEDPDAMDEEGSDRKLNEEKKNESERTYDNDRIETQTKSRGARITKVNVAVTVDSSEAPMTKSKDGKNGKVAWDVNEFIRLVSLAVGADKYGEDGRVEVKLMDYYKPVDEVVEVDQVEKVLTNLERLSSNPLVRPIVAFILLAFLFRMFRKYFGRTDIEGSEVESEELIEETVHDKLAGGEVAEEVEEEVEEELEPDELTQMIMEVKEQASASPEIVASIMEGWLTSE